MKIYAYILIVLSGVLTAQCSKVTLDEICGYPSAPGGGNGEGEGNGDYNSYWYYSYEAAQLIDAETLGMETAEDFTPYTVAHLGDTLFIANIGKAGSSLLLFSIKKGERLGTLQSWQHDGGEKSFGSQIEAIVPSGNRLYVAERQSRIHVFRLPELSYLTCIGNGQWSGMITLDGKDITRESIRQRSKDGMSHIPEDRHKHGLVLDYSLENNMVLQRYWQPEFQKGGFIRSDKVREYSDRLIAQYDVRSGQGSSTIVRSMSGGNQQKAIIAREVDRDKSLIVAVQPTRGLDVGAIEYIHSQLVAERDRGKAVLLVSLELDEVMSLSDRILVMYEGRLVGQLNPKTTTVAELGLYMSGAKRDDMGGDQA